LVLFVSVISCLQNLTGRLEKECACVLQAETAAAAIGKRPISISSEVAQFTFKETGTEEAGAFEMVSFVSQPLEET
jgi:hypothetical protein